jgi:hypothetical protein
MFGLVFFEMSLKLEDEAAVRSTRAELADFEKENPTAKSYGSDFTYAERSREEFGKPLDEYAKMMKHSRVYGGGFEIDAYSKKYNCRVVVYERADGMFRAISSYEVPGFTSTKHLLYDALRASEARGTEGNPHYTRQKNARATRSHALVACGLWCSFLVSLLARS